MNIDQFLERAAIMEFSGGLSRYQAETEAAKAQGVARWKALQEVENAKRSGHFEQGGNLSQAVERQCADNLPGVQPVTSQQAGPVPIGDVQAGRSSLALLALRASGRGVL